MEGAISCLMNTKEVAVAEQDKRSEALGIAVRMERQGMELYRKASERTVHPFAKKMFLSLVEDEKRHEEIFQRMAEAAGVRPSAVDEMDKEGPLERISAIFRETALQLNEELRPDDDDIKVMDIAKDLERKAYDFYTAAAKQMSDALEKTAFERIAAEENEHWRILDDTKLYLTNPAEWHIKEERPLIDGG